MFKLLQKLSVAVLDAARVYLYMLAVVLGLSSGFLLAVGSVWSRQHSELPDSDFVFIGGNMMFWATFVSVVISIPLAVLGSLLLQDRAVPLVRFGFGRSHFMMLTLGQVWRAVLSAAVLAIILHFPFLALLAGLPHDDGGDLVEVTVYGIPSLMGIVLAVVTLLLPAAVSVLVLSSRLLRGEARGRRNAGKLKSVVLPLLCVAIGVAIIAAGYGDRSQAGILFTFGLLLIGIVAALKIAPQLVVWLARGATNAIGYKPVPALTQSLAVQYQSRFGGICVFVFLITSIPSLIFTASAIQGEAEGEGGVAQWDFWMLFAAPIILILIAVVGASIVLSQLLVNSLSQFVRSGISMISNRWSLFALLCLVVFSAMTVVVVAVVALVAMMAGLWGVGLMTALSLVYWIPLVGVALAIIVFAPLLYAVSRPEKKVLAFAQARRGITSGQILSIDSSTG